MLKMKEEIARLTQETNRERSSSCSTTEEEAEAFVQSWEHILQMIDERTIYEEEAQADDEDGEYDRRREEEEKYLVYDDSGEMTPRGRMPMLVPFNCLLTKE
jgi:DNA-binding protein H-NS